MENGILIIGGKHHGQVIKSDLEYVQLPADGERFESYTKRKFVDGYGDFAALTECYVLDGLMDPLRQVIDLAKQAGELIEVLKMSSSGFHKNDDNQPCLCSQCEFVRKRNKLLAKISAIKINN